ncbi:secreted tripeptidyl aminopeptidase [Streptomyces viridochromogenes DSM 40736]|uniref:Secreted tripeptidyl aminopeptidase n=1 Tax=Streptomyces viridochromogenes (strain DSM 40736 / JCM 4977 / BCRC 1201 / Tue 494) TaxID=591159 RepID=D9X4V6_STRVT|nr:S28 family serine protease [Streptomyces viridochromogenes]EFL31694.1 secreted tripeptidyl aminopeptidase [Streptomyces viridochromogenes DSM 40736]
MRVWTRRRLLTSAATAVSAAGLAATTALPARAAAGGTRPGTGDIADALRALPGLRLIEERHDAEPGYRHFVLGLRQPVDHTDPAAGTFEQRLTLLHTGADRPTVLFSTGYHAVLTPRRMEPAVLLGANQLQVEHRYFGASRPAGTGYAHLTIRQAADDHHRVVLLFRRLYRGAWISTGSSKGGMVSVYHRRFHPHDVDGTVAYSAPNNVDDRENSAYLRFLETVGTPAGREAVKSAQRQMLLRRTEMVARYEAWAVANNDTFRIIGSADQAFEIAVLRVLFMFWQRADAPDIAAIPGPQASTDELYTWLDNWAGLSLYADKAAQRYVPYWYQIGTQLGYGDVPTGHLADLLRHSGGIAARNFVPRDIPMVFDRDAMPDIDRWVRRRGSRLLFVNGTQDPSVAEYFHPGGRDARTLWVPDGNHSVDIANLSPADRASAEDALHRWAGQEVPARSS